MAPSRRTRGVQDEGYETPETYEEYRGRYQECIRMLNGMERTLEKQLPEHERRWPPSQSLAESHGEYDAPARGYPRLRNRVSGVSQEPGT